MKSLLAALLLIFAGSAFAANPAYTSFSTDQFNANSSVGVKIKPGVLITNPVISGIISSTNLASISNILWQHSGGCLTLLSNGVIISGCVTGINLTGLTTITQANGLVSVSFPAGGGGGNFNPAQFGTNGASQVSVKDGASVTNLTNQGRMFLTNITGNGRHIEVVSTPTKTYANAHFSMLDVKDTNGFLLASFGYTPADGTSKYGEMSLFGSATAAYGNLGGLFVWNTNLYGGDTNQDRRVFVWRWKDPGGGLTDAGGYTLFENKYTPGASDSIEDDNAFFANFMLCDGEGNVGLGNLLNASDAAPGVHPWAKTTFYGYRDGMFGNYPLLGFLPYQLLVAPVTNSMEYNGTGWYFVNSANVRRRMALTSTNISDLFMPLDLGSGLTGTTNNGRVSVTASGGGGGTGIQTNKGTGTENTFTNGTLTGITTNGANSNLRFLDPAGPNWWDFGIKSADTTFTVTNNNTGLWMVFNNDENAEARMNLYNHVHVKQDLTVEGFLDIATAGSIGMRITADDATTTFNQLSSGSQWLNWDGNELNLKLGNPGGGSVTVPIGELRVEVGALFSVMGASQMSGTNYMTNGFASFSTNTVLVLDPKGYTNTSGINMFARYGGTSGTMVYYNRSGANGQTVCGTALYTNTVISSGEVIPVPVNSGIQVVTGVGVTGSAFAQ